jgi:ribonuclease J
LLAHARLAETCGVPQAIVTRDGEVVKLAPGAPAVIGEVETGRLVVDGKTLLPLGGEALKNRQRMTWNGAALATVVVDAEGRLKAPPQVSVQGLAEDAAAVAAALQGAVQRAVADLPARERRDDAALREAVRLAIRRALKVSSGKRPVTEIHVVRIA